jgi:hypothetical protein
MKLFRPALLLALPAALFAQRHMRDHFSDDPFLTGGTKSILIEPLQPQVSFRALAASTVLPRTVELDIDTAKYPLGITSFKIIAGAKTHLITSRNFEIVLWPNYLRIRQNLSSGKVIIESQQGFLRVTASEALDYINARPERVYIRNGSGWLSRKVEIDCPADCSFVLGARPKGAPKP